MGVVEQNVLDRKRQTVIDASLSKWHKLKDDYIKLKGSFTDIQGKQLPEPRLDLGNNRVEVECDMRSVSSKSSSSTQKSMRLRLIQQQRDLHKIQRENLQKEQELLRQQEEIINEMPESDDDIQETTTNQRKKHAMDPLAPEFTPALPTIRTNFQIPPPLTQRELSARKIYRDLPVFTGNAEEWPLFKRMFEQSTQACGYSVDENLMRLQQALKGRARSLVSSQLAEPSCVPQIIESLSTAFGQPTIILDSQLEKLSRLPIVKADKLETILEFSTGVTNLNAVMKASGLEDQYDNPLLLKELLKKLTSEMKMRWATYSLDKGKKGVLAFGCWLQEESRKVYEVLSSSELGGNKRDVRSDKHSQSRVNVHVQSKKIKTCEVCGKMCVSLEVCEVFKQMNSLARWEKMKELKLCCQCLTAHTMKYPFVCKKAVKCNFVGCTRKHHPLMHPEDEGVTNPPVIITSQNSHTEMGEQFQFQYLPVTLRNGLKKVEVLAFLDNGSSGTRIEEKVAEQLGLTGPKVILHLKWTANIRRQEESKRVSVLISGVHKGAKEFEIPTAHTIKELNLPKQTLHYNNIAKEYPHLRGIPVNSYSAEQPSIMIGLSDWHLAVPVKARLAGRDDPVATKCKLGWSVFGSGSSLSHQSINYHVEEYTESSDQSLNDMMKQYFAVDSLGVKIPDNDLASKEERRAVQIMENTTKFDGKRYETGLLWRYDDAVMPNSLSMARHRLMTLNKRLQKNPELKAGMQEQIDHYIKMGYVRKLSSEELKLKFKRVWYLPLFSVVNPNKPSKLRVVWDTAAKVNGMSLNSFLLKGPDQLSSLLGILIRFRENAVALSGDISEMFHQIRLTSEDQHACRFLWDDGKGEAVFITQVMTFGATCSPSSAQFVKNKNAQKYEKEFPRAVKAIVRNHYVDDLLESVSTPEEAIILAKEVRAIHSAGGFQIRKWKSNSSQVISALENGPTDGDDNNFSLDKENVNSTEKVLGMWWDTKTDSLTFSLKFNKGNKEVLNGERKPTKREVLKEIWRSKVNWDDGIEDDHHEKWLRWLHELPKVEQVFIPRCLLPESTWTLANTQLHVFVDASKDCSAAIAYLRVEINGQITCSLLGSKTKVAPIKLISIPRLELVAALIGARLANNLNQSLSFRPNRTVFWSDSITTLTWLRSDAKTVKGQFVAFRIAEVQEITNVADWRYLPSGMNPADDATKWKKGPSLDMKDRWMQAPTFLYTLEQEWPEDISLHKGVQHTVVNESVHQNIRSVIPMEKFEKWSKLIKITAMVYRYSEALRGRKRKNRYLSSDEYERAELLIYKLIQSESLGSEMKYLKEQTSYHNTNKISKVFSNSVLSMKLYLDEDGLMRSQSRIDNAKFLSLNSRRPIILPHNHHATTLLVKDYHERFRHINHETVVNEMRKKYFIPRLRQLLKQVRKNCNRCKILTAKASPPEMAALPESRVTAFTPPFTFTAVDYGGPFEVVNGRKIEKRWICLFTCLITRAIHIEIAYKCSADSFILCYRNFICRRGKVKQMYSDQGTNFIGAEKLLKSNLKTVDHQAIASKFVDSDLEWFFHPPGSPHMNGCCERLIKSVKIALYAVSNITIYKPNDELFRSYLMEVEEMINSRPLTYLPLDSEHSEAITPNHFLRQSNEGIPPLGEFKDDAKLLETNALMSQLYARHFWKRWVSEYLPTLARRDKWNTPAEPLAVGDLVLVVDERNPRNQWQKGRIVKVIQAKDGQVRSAAVQTETGIYQRPAVKLAKLDIREKGGTFGQSLGQCTEGENVKK